MTREDFLKRRHTGVRKTSGKAQYKQSEQHTQRMGVRRNRGLVTDEGGGEGVAGERPLYTHCSRISMKSNGYNIRNLRLE